MAIGGLKLFVLITCCALLSVSFVGTRAFLRAEAAEPATRGLAPSEAKQRLVEIPLASTLDLMALRDDQILQARGALIRTLSNRLRGHPDCFDGADASVQGTVRARYRLAARGGAVHANLVDTATYLPGDRPVKPHDEQNAFNRSVESCLVSRLDRQFAVTPARGRLTFEGDLGEKTFAIRVGGGARGCGL
jgi:hypothetical protein